MEKLPGVSKRVQRIRGRVFLWICILVAFVAGASGASANEGAVANKLKVAFLLNFAKFTTWPPAVFADSQDHFLLCVDKNDPFDGALDVLSQKKVGGRAIQIRYATNITQNDAPCHLVYLSRDEIDRQGPVIEAVAGKPVLTVSDIPGFAQAGGIIELRWQGERLAFVVNNHAAQAAGLHLSASFLHLALEVL